MKKQYVKPRMIQEDIFVEQVSAACISGNCCPHGRTTYSLSYCHVKCTLRTHTLDPVTGNVISSDCPRFMNKEISK